MDAVWRFSERFMEFDQEFSGLAVLHSNPIRSFIGSLPNITTIDATTNHRDTRLAYETTRGPPMDSLRQATQRHHRLVETTAGTTDCFGQPNHQDNHRDNRWDSGQASHQTA